MYVVKQHNPITMILSNIIDWFVVYDPEIECLVRVMWDFIHGVHPKGLEWRLRNHEHLVPYFKTSPMDWLNYYVSGSWLKSPQFKHHLPAKTQISGNSILHSFELHRPSSKGTKLLFRVMKIIITYNTENVSGKVPSQKKVASTV